MNVVAPICSHDGCKVQTDGICSLGHDPVESCPNYASDAAPVEEFEESEEPRPALPVKIWSSEKMLLVDYSSLARARRLRTVALVGEEKVGKTTLLCSIYTSTDLIGKLDEFRLADRVCFLLDGGRLASKDDRTAYTRNFRQMINALHDNGALARAKEFEILATKLDITRSSDAADVGYLNDFQARVVSDFAKKGIVISSHEVCALPKADRTVGIVGLDDLIRRWSESAPLPDVTPRPVADAPRQIDRLLSKIAEGS